MSATLPDIPLAVLQTLTPEQAWHYHVIPVKTGEGSYELYMEESCDVASTQAELEMVLGATVKLIPFDGAALKVGLSKLYPRTSNAPKNQVRARSNDFLSELIQEAHAIGSSDIHIESYEGQSRVRFRIDGKLVERYSIPSAEYPAMVNKIKIKANLDIAEKRLPQDGRILFKEGNSNIDIRVSVLPAMFGEKVVMRLLNKDSTDIDIQGLGFDQQQLKTYLEGTKKSHGIILISGPTGSGKTTTLYATLKVLNKPEVNILTIEDPIEYTLDGINQVQLKEAIGLNFASALRTFLRQDPDVIMLGEIRDPETAQMATRAALTGHLVLSTIHTNSALGTITRLADMDVPGFLVAGTLNLSVAQRLVRMLCPHCKTEETFDASTLPPNYSKKDTPKGHFVPVGCEQCFYTGYKGRKAVYEVLPITRDLAAQIRHGKLNEAAVKEQTGIQFLHESAYELFRQGATSLEEIYPILLTGTF